MRIIIPLVFDYDATAWAHEHGIAETDAFNDFAALLHRTVNNGAIAGALDTVLPVMRGHITAHPVDGLDSAHQRELGRRRPRWVIFHTMEWDNGSFLTSSDATVYFPNGDNAPVDFHGCGVDDLLTDMYGARGSMAALGVDLRDGTLEFDDYADNVPDLLGIPARKHQRG